MASGLKKRKSGVWLFFNEESWDEENECEVLKKKKSGELEICKTN
jgi:hypothetical protein